jgi:hypothetical protein
MHSAVIRRICVLALTLVVTVVSCLFTNVLAEEQDPKQPTLGDLMTLAQLRHFKLWYAHKEDNWKLAGYELDQFKSTIERIKKLYPMVSSVAQESLITEKTEPAMAALSDAVREKNNARFEAAFVTITKACNECHLAAGIDFIRVQVPTKSPYSNQNFKPMR